MNDDWETSLTREPRWAPANDFAALDLVGPDAATWFHNFCTNDIKRLRSGQGCEAFVTSLQGRTLALVHAYRHEQGVWLDVLGVDAHALVAALVKHLDKYLLMEKVKLRPATNVAAWWIAGAQSGDVVRRLFATEPPATLFEHVVVPAIEGVVRRVDDLGEETFRLVAPRERTNEIESLLRATGGASLSSDAIESARIAWGTPRNGREVVEERLPQDLDRDARAISFTKGCYLGQETVARLDALGHANWKLVRVDLPSAASPTAGAELTTADGKSVGALTSVAPCAGSNGQRAALAIVRRTTATLGALLQSSEYQASVAPTPWKTNGAS